MTSRWHKIPLLALALAALAIAATPQNVPKATSLKPNGFVNDYAHVLSPDAKAQLEQAAAALNQALKVQVAMVTVTTTGQTDAFDYSFALAQHWGVGAKTAANGQDKDTGLLIFLAVKDHKYFTQVGYGLEPYITDADVGTWMRALKPELRAGRYGAVFAGMLQQIETTLAARMPGAAKQLQALNAQNQMPSRSGMRYSGGRGSPAGQLGFLAFFVIIWIIGMFAMRGRGGGGCFWPLLFLGMMNGGFGGGGGGWGGGFGGGGGGFGGFGGGGFGGGGAGGSW
ncbi:MAG: TPM domain-containing protein [Terriglobales bacterium]